MDNIAKLKNYKSSKIRSICRKVETVTEVSQSCSNSKITAEPTNSYTHIVRSSKRIKLETSRSSNVDKRKGSKRDDNLKSNVRSLKRSCKLWSIEDKNIFFKALNEYGKDFNALQCYFFRQGRKKGLSDVMIKNRKQIRHFYYRTWIKVSEHLKFPEGVRRTSQELYALINYGELRRRLPRINKKVLLRLNELVYYGSTQIRFKGKTVRIKTPICRALRKLNHLKDLQEENKLPSKVTIELIPRNNLTWWYVQSLSMNPRVRILLPMQKQLSSLLTFLQQRWQPIKNSTSATAESEIRDTWQFRVAPREGCKITVPTEKHGEHLTSHSVCLNSYENRLGLHNSETDILETLGGKSTDTPLLDDYLENTKQSKEVESSKLPGRETVERIREGWNIEEASAITIGELFLMCGRETKVKLEYWWDSRKQQTEESMSSSLVNENLCLTLRKLLSIAKYTFGMNKIFDNSSGTNETMTSPSTTDSAFRRPVIPQSSHKSGTMDTSKAQLNNFKTRFCKQGRTVKQKSLIVQRVLPIISSVSNLSEDVTINNQTPEKLEFSMRNNIQEDNNSSLINVGEIQEKRFLDDLDVPRGMKTMNSTIINATQLLKEGEQQWLNNEVTDFSLSSFLGQLESSVKCLQKGQNGENIVEDSRPCSEIASHVQCLMRENSVDYMMKFANLASQIASDDNKK